MTRFPSWAAQTRTLPVGLKTCRSFTPTDAHKQQSSAHLFDRSLPAPVVCRLLTLQEKNTHGIGDNRQQTSCSFCQTFEDFLYPLISPLTAMSNLKTSRLWCMQVPSIMHVVVATNPQQESWKLLKEMYYLTIHSSPHEFPYFHRCFLQTCAKWFIGVNRSVSDHFSWGKGGLWRAAAVPPGSGCCIHSQTYLCKKRWRYRILCRIKRNRMENRKIFLFYLCPTPVLDWRTRLFSWFCLFTAPLSKNFIPATYSLVGETNKKIHVF